MRVVRTVQVVLALATLASGEPASNLQYVVLGTDGKVVVGADPSPYFCRNKVTLDKCQQDEPFRSLQESQPPRVLGVRLEALDTVETAPDSEVSFAVLPHVPVALLPSKQSETDVQESEDDEFSVASDTSSSPMLTWGAFLAIDESDSPGVHGSVVFAELSCFFVAFIGYLVHSIPLWGSFSRGQKCCLVVAFSSAALFQLAVLAWSLGAVSPEAMLGLSSLITRMISLGMVPITTTSFMGRAREICQDANTSNSSSGSGSSASRSSRRHHSRARSS